MKRDFAYLRPIFVVYIFHRGSFSKPKTFNLIDIELEMNDNAKISHGILSDVCYRDSMLLESRDFLWQTT